MVREDSYSSEAIVRLNDSYGNFLPHDVAVIEQYAIIISC